MQTRCKRKNKMLLGEEIHRFTTTTVCRGKQMVFFALVSFMSSCLMARCKGKERRAAEKKRKTVSGGT